ncbi:MAG: hypothetical protein ACRD23_17340 [Terriglobales bacterium]
MRIRRRLPIWFGVVLVAAAIALAVALRKHAPPEPARLLPGADGYFYVDLKWVRRANIAGQLPDVPHEPEYEQFIQATGFQFERDLDQAAFAIHYPVKRKAQPATPQPSRFSEVFVGKIDGERLRAYLGKISGSVENYRSVDIYSIPLEGRTLRVAVLGVDTVAASNHDDPMVIRGIVDRSRKVASPFGGPALLRRYYKYVPLASLAWAIFKVDPVDSAPSPNALSFLFTKPATVVASARYLGRVHFRAEAFTGSADDAQRLTEQLGTFLQLFHTAEGKVATPDNDPDMKAFFDGLRVTRHDDRAVLTAAIPPGFIRKAVVSPPAEAQPMPAPLPPASKNK